MLSSNKKRLRVVVLGAGFGGLEITSVLSEKIGDRLDLTLIDKNDSFFFGSSKLDVMFGRTPGKSLKIAYGTSKALLKSFEEKNIRYIPENMVGSIDPAEQLAVLDDGTEFPFDLFLGIPEHCVPKVVLESGMVFDEWIPVDRKNLKTRFPHVYAIGDVTSVGAPKAGIFAEGAARIAAESIIAELDGYEYPQAYDGKGTCYVEFGEGMVGRTDVDFFSNPSPTGIHFEASQALAAEKKSFETFRKARWFGISE